VNLSDVSIRRPVFAAMLIVGLVVLGLVSLGRLEMQLDPDIEFPFATVTTELRGASPETVEREVTDVLEEQINGIEGIRTLSSVSSEGLSRIGIEFGLDYDIDLKVQEVRDKVAGARPLLPLDVENPVVGKFDLNAISMMNIVLGGSLSLRDLSDLADASARSASGWIRCGSPATGSRSRTSRTRSSRRTRSWRAGGSRERSANGPSPRRARRAASRTSASSWLRSGPAGWSGCATWRSSRTAWPRPKASRG
jgi:hypothetical protein